MMPRFKIVLTILAAGFIVAIMPGSVIASVAPLEALESPPAHQLEDQPHPIIPSDGTWAGSVAIVIMGMFVAAAVIGPIVRANMPEEIPPAHSHDEPPGTSHHHGVSGTLELEEPGSHRPAH